MTDIFITSWNRSQFTSECVRLIRERTTAGTYRLHVFDNGSNAETVDYLQWLYAERKIDSLYLDSRNTGCLYNKGIFHMMCPDDSPYYIVSDNDVFPPKLSPDWLSQMITIMDRHPKLGLLTPQLPPQWLQMPEGRMDDEVVYCGAVGNTFKIVRREAFPIDKFQVKIGAYGDDGLVSAQMKAAGWDVAFCRHIYCWHAGQYTNWGYNPQEVAQDPRKAGYGKPYVYTPVDTDTYLPPIELRMG